MIRAVEPTKQNATLGRARESLSTEEIFGGNVNGKRGPQKISGGGIQDRKQSKSGCSEERHPHVAEDGRRCGSLVTKVEMRQAEGTWWVRHLLWVRALWPQCCAAEGKAPTVGQDTVVTVLCCRG